MDHLIPLHRSFSCVWCFRASTQTSLTQTAVARASATPSDCRRLWFSGKCAPASSSSSSSSSLLTAVNRNTQGAEDNSRIAVSNGKGFQSRLTARCLWGVVNFAPDFAVRNCWQRSLNSGCTTHRYRSLITLYVYVFCFETVVHIVKLFVPSGSGITVLILLAVSAPPLQNSKETCRRGVKYPRVRNSCFLVLSIILVLVLALRWHFRFRCRFSFGSMFVRFSFSYSFGGIFVLVLTCMLIWYD